MNLFRVSVSLVLDDAIREVRVSNLDLEQHLHLRFIRQIRPQPPLHLRRPHPLTRGIVLHLVFLNLAHREVTRFTVREVEATHRGGGAHRIALGEGEAGGFGVQQGEQGALFGVVGLRGIAGGGADAAVTLADEVVAAQILVRCVAPEFAPDALVESFGKGLGKAVSQGLD